MKGILSQVYSQIILLDNGCQDELSAESCLNIKEFGSCELDLAKTHCKKTCDKCEDEESTTEDEGITAIQCNKDIILRLHIPLKSSYY